MTRGFPSLRMRTALGAVALALAPGVGQASDPPALSTTRQLTLESAKVAAEAALAACRDQGATVAVAVTERSGLPLVILRDPLAGMHTPDTALGKARTAISFKSATTELVRATGPETPNQGIRHLPGVVVLGGGLPVEAAGSLVGGIGVSGAPSGQLDEDCAREGIDAIAEMLEFG
jgi:uncharacterized protein GlcG (DUF336 family)